MYTCLQYIYKLLLAVGAARKSQLDMGMGRAMLAPSTGGLLPAATAAQLQTPDS
jgi:hypothetical protein